MTHMLDTTTTAASTTTAPTDTAPIPKPLDPPERLLMGPGPSNPDPRVLAAMSKRVVGHLDPYFVNTMDETMGMLRRVYRTQNHHTIPVSGTGSAGLEAIMLNLLEPGDSAIVCIMGYFGQRLAELARRSGADVRTIEVPQGQVIDPDEVAARFRERPAKVLAFVHAETTTGALQSIPEMVAIARQYDALVAMDCVTSLGGIPIEIDALGVDAAGSCTQKCIGAPPGLAPVTISGRAMDRVRSRTHKPSTWYLDFSLLFQYWGEESAARTRAFHHTAPISSIYGIHEALRLILEEGLEARWVRHQAAHETLVRGLERLGVSVFTPAENRCATINVVNVPEGVDEARVRRKLLERGVEMSGGLGALAGKVWRIGVMGHNAQEERVERFLGALEEVLATERQGAA